MGTGEHGGFGHTRGKRTVGVSGLYSPIWFEGSVNVGGEVRDVSRKVYQRSDIDVDYYDPKTGKTNLDLMKCGRAPIGNDGKPIQLHYVLQKESGPVAEIRETTHSEYHRILHGLVGSGDSFRNDRELERQFSNFKRKHWRWRAQQYLEVGKR